MRQVTRTIAAFVVLALFAGLTGWISADEKDPSIKEVMTKAHKKGDGILSKVEKDLKGDKPDWDSVTKESKELVELGVALGKAKPPKGEMSSWEKLTKEYQANAKDLMAAADKKEKKDAEASLGKLQKSCGACHGAHKPAKKKD